MPHILRLRPATRADIPLLEAWDEEPHVQFSDPDAGDGSGWDWHAQIGAGWPGFEELVAEAGGQPIGFVQILDPEVEPSQYWGTMPAGFRAIDIWIGPADWLGRGCGTEMMQLALAKCFADPAVHTVLVDPLASNTRAHRFYQRCGFTPARLQMLGEDRCLVHELKRADWRKEPTP